MPIGLQNSIVMRPNYHYIDATSVSPSCSLQADAVRRAQTTSATAAAPESFLSITSASDATSWSMLPHSFLACQTVSAS